MPRLRSMAASGHRTEVLLPWRDLRVSNGDRDPVSILSDQGLILAPWGRASDLRDFLNASRPTKIARRIDRAGWQEGGAAFALPSQIIGSGKEELLWAGKQTHAAAAFAKAGTLDEWQATIAAPAASHPLLVETATSLPPGRALDLACGTGHNALWMAQHGWSVTALDGSATAIEILRRRGAGVKGQDVRREERRGEAPAPGSSWRARERWRPSPGLRERSR